MEKSTLGSGVAALKVVGARAAKEVLRRNALEFIETAARRVQVNGPNLCVE